MEGCTVCYDFKYNNSLEVEKTGTILKNSLQYLHSALVKEDPNSVQYDNQAWLCKQCFTTTLKLTQLNEQLLELQKEITDLSITYSLAVLHRRSQASKQNKEIPSKDQQKQILELDVSDLPPNLFSTQNEQMESNVEEFEDAEENFEVENVDLGNMQPISDTSLLNSVVEVQYDDPFTNLMDEGNPDDIDINNYYDLVADPLQESEVIPVPIIENVGSTSKIIKEDGKETSDILETIKTKDLRILIQKLPLDASKNKHREKGLKQPSRMNQIRRKRMKINTGPYKCKKCPEIFNTRTKLVIHVRSHKGKNVTHQCSFCSKVFPYAQNLKQHQISHSREKRFKCKTCDKKFKYLIGLVNHERIHSGEAFLCLYCNKSFTEQRHLRNHKRIHTGEKFNCSYCEASYVNEHNLRRHEKLHTGERDFQCGNCEKSFTEKRSLLRHQKRHM